MIRFRTTKLLCLVPILLSATIDLFSVPIMGKPIEPAERQDQAWKVVSLLEDSGLSNRNIFWIDFEKDGTAWIATSDGLVRYDGYQWQRFSEESGLPSRFVRCVLVTAEGTIWVGTDKGAGIFDGRSFDSAGSEKGLASPNVRRIVQDRDSSLWFCSDRWPDARVQGGLTHLKNGRWTVFREADGLPSNYVVDYFRDSRGRQYVLTLSGVAKWEHERWTVPSELKGLSGINWSSAAMVESTFAGVMLSTGKELFILREKGWQRQALNVNLSYGLTTSVDGQVFACGSSSDGEPRQHGFFRWTGSTFERVSSMVPSPATKFVEAVREAPDGALWAVGFDFLIRWDRSSEEWTEYLGLPPARLADESGGVWFFSEGQAVRLYRNEWRSVDFPCQTALADAKGQVWGLAPEFMMRWSKDQARRFSSKETRLARHQGLDFDRQGRCWVYGRDRNATFSVAILDGEDAETQSFPELRDRTFLRSSPDPEDGVWYLFSGDGVGSYVLAHIFGQPLQARILKPALLSAFYPNLHVDRQQWVWFFGDAGLFRLDPQKGDQFQQIKELPGRSIFACGERNDGLWFASNGTTGGRSGLARFSNDRWTMFEAEVQFAKGDEADGTLYFGGDDRFYLISDASPDAPIEVNLPGRGPIRKMIKDRDGNYWLSLSQSVLRYHPTSTPPETVVAAATTQVRAGNPLNLEFHGIARFQPRNTHRGFQYSWRIGSGSWTEFQPESRVVISTATYSPGDYSLQVRAKDAAMNLDPSPAVLNFVITSVPLQERFWFKPAIAGVFILICGLAAVAFVARRRLGLHARDLERIVDQRTSQLRQSEERLRQSQKIEAVGRLAGGIAHDFNNLLTAILGHCELLLIQERLSQEMRQDIEVIKKAGERAADLTRQLLAFSRKQILQPKVFDLSGVVTDMSKMLGRLIGEHIELVVSTPDEKCLVKADPGQIEQVILNLVVNARDAMPGGGKLTLEVGELRPDAANAMPNGHWGSAGDVLLTVTDNGSGMSPEVRARAFDPFFTTKEFGKGTGLGLSTVHGIVEQSGGHVWLSSELGRGTTARVCLPRAAEGESVAEVQPMARRQAVNGKETVLLVEDEAIVRKAVTEMLSRYGYQVLAASGADEAVQLAALHPSGIRLMITDVVMPGTSGRELATRLTSSRPDLRVLYMSGYADDFLGQHGVIEEDVSFIQKPFSAEVLAARIRTLLDNAEN